MEKIAKFWASILDTESNIIRRKSLAWAAFTKFKNINVKLRRFFYVFAYICRKESILYLITHQILFRF